MRGQLADILRKLLIYFRNLSLPGDLLVGIDASSEGIQIVTIRKNLRGFQIVMNKCFALPAEKVASIEVPEFITNAAHIAIVLPVTEIHYLLAARGDKSAERLGGETLAEVNGLQKSYMKISTQTDLVTLWKPSDKNEQPFGSLSRRACLLAKINALHQLTREFPLSGAMIRASANEGCWQLTHTDSSSNLELIAEEFQCEKLTDKYGKSITELYSISLPVTQLAAFGAALFLLQKESSLVDLSVAANKNSIHPDRIRYLSFRGILFIGLVTILLYSLIAVTSFGLSNQHFALQEQNNLLAEQKTELSRLQQSCSHLNRHKQMLDSLSSPSTFTAIQLLQFAGAVPKGVWLSTVSSAEESKIWKISGFSTGEERVAKLLNEVELLGSVDKIILRQLLSRSEFRSSIKQKNRFGGNVYFEVFIETL